MRPLNGDDKVVMVNEKGEPASGVAALPENLAPATGEVEGALVIVVVQEDARTARCKPAPLSAVRTDGTGCFLAQERVLAFARSWNGGKAYVAAQNKLLRQQQSTAQAQSVDSNLSILASGSTSGPQGTRAKLYTARRSGRRLKT